MSDNAALALLISIWVSGLATFVLFWTNVIYFAMWLFDKIPAYPTALIWWLVIMFVIYIATLIVAVVSD